MRSPKPPALAWAALALTVIAALAGACTDGRFPVCKSNADCQKNAGSAGGKVCSNLKCVECQYDSDCAVGSACNRNLNTCQSILGPTPGADEPKEPQTSWEPANWDECAKRCKAQACLSDCDARFGK